MCQHSKVAPSVKIKAEVSLQSEERTSPADDEVQLIESLVIVEYVENRYKRQGTTLLPADPAKLAKVIIKKMPCDFY